MSYRLFRSVGLTLIFGFSFLIPPASLAVTSFNGLNPGESSKADVDKKLGQPTKELKDSKYEYSGKSIDYVIEFKKRDKGEIVDKMDLYFKKPVKKSSIRKKFKLEESPDYSGLNEKKKLLQYYGGKKSLILNYQGKDEKTGILIISFLSRERFESIPKENLNRVAITKREGSNKNVQEKTTDTETKVNKEIASISTEAKQHLQQGMTYASLAQTNPKTKSENYENALLEFSNAIEAYPDYAEAYSNRGVVYMQQKKYNMAEEDLKKAAELNPNDPIIQFNLAALYSIQNKTDLALDALDRALENGFNNYDALKPTGRHSDSDLKNLREDPEFRKVLEKHKVFILK